MIYLDWAATTPPDPEVTDIMAQSARKYFGNPSSLYPEGRKARTALNDARNRCAMALGCKDDQLVFTSGGTESNTIALLSRLLIREPGTLIVSGLEHPSVTEPVRILNSYGWNIKVLQPGADSLVRPGKLTRMLEKYPDTRMVTVMGVNNETGAIQPLEELIIAVRNVQGVHKRPIHFHSDLVQAVGKIHINLADYEFDTAAFSAHKFRGSRGIGLLYHRSQKFEALIRGGGQEYGLRPGTENVAGAMAMAAALERYGQPKQSVNENGEWLLQRLAELPEAKIIPANRHPASIDPVDENTKISYVPGIIAVAFPPIPGEVLARILAQSGYAVSTGSACSHNKRDGSSRTMTSLGVSKDVAAGMIRISLGPSTERGELESFIKALKHHLTALKLR